MQRLKLVLIIVAALLILIVVLQNMERMPTEILFITVTMPRAVLLFITLVIGYVLGLVTSGKVLRRRLR